jgi:hypothetical protein
MTHWTVEILECLTQTANELVVTLSTRIDTVSTIFAGLSVTAIIRVSVALFRSNTFAGNRVKDSIVRTSFPLRSPIEANNIVMLADATRIKTVRFILAKLIFRFRRT